jgi:hypothetical protein
LICSTLNSGSLLMSFGGGGVWTCWGNATMATVKGAAVCMACRLLYSLRRAEA